MGKKVFIDTNILLDVFLLREPYCVDAQILLSLVEKKKIKGFISALSICNSYYIVKKLASVKNALIATGFLLDFFEVVALDKSFIQKAVHSRWEDFEDNVQHETALNAQVTLIVTRDPSGFKKSLVPVMTPSQYLGAFIVN